MKQDRKITNYQDESRPLFAGIDIGSAHAVCVVGTIDHEKKIINVLGGGTTDSSGIEAGAITNIAEAASSIKSALEKAERIAGGHAEAAVVAIRGSFIEARGAVGTAATDISTKTVTQEVKDNAVNNAQETVTGELPANSDVFQVVVRGLLLDKNKGSVGMKGLSLEADVYALSAPLFNMENINSSLETAEIKSIKMIYSYLASSDILIRQEEYEGCLIVDFGGSTIGLVIYVDKTLRFTYEFPTGSEMITKGISR
ncbi:MAG: hypothetical protein LBV66_00345, partial [Elusimicrobiota bacterium]|nr:hypothetical protein [Elusimicrobiota bacterium]